jgi:hypothetical protein
MNHPAKYIMHYLDTSTFYTKNIFDYNLMDKYKYNILQKKYQTIYNQPIENDFNFIKLNNPLHMTPVSNNCDLHNPVYNPSNIQVGLISNSSIKFCNNLLLVINKMLYYNQNIYLNIYTYVNNDWLLNNFTKFKDRIKIKSYSNWDYKKEFQNNILFLDTFICNGHSTAMEILSSLRPFISYNNDEKFFGSISSTMIEHIGMSKELCANNPLSYLKLVLYHLQSKENYDKLYNKFIYKLKNSGIIDNKIYARELYNELEKLNN